MLLAVAVVAVLLLCFYWYFSQGSAPAGAKWPTELRGNLPLIGHLFSLLRERNTVLEWFTSNTFQYDCWKIHTPHLGSLVCLRDAESVEFMLKTDFENFPKGARFQWALGPLLGNGIFVADGELWRGQRKTFASLFKTRVLKTGMFDTFLHHGHVVKDILSKSKRLNVLDLFYRYTLDSIGVIGFGVDLKTLLQPNPVGSAFDQSLEILRENMIWKPHYLKLSQYASILRPDLRRALDILNEYAAQLIKERRQDPLVSQKTDVLSIYITHTDEDDTKLRDVIMSFLIAGRDTTGQTLQWLFYLLSQNPQVEEKLLAELETVLGGREPTFVDLKSMKYLDFCIKETLRLYPPVPYNGKSVANDLVLPNGYALRKGEFIFFGPWVLGRDPKVWDRPNDFWPERWETAKVSELHPYQYIP